ncbi:branched-chain amino acid ABC transporter permease [Nocardioides sp. zg-579]|uniref:Branched-chain amino acid ABC transporter permease n=1 Tax=Nocardioides marmotae TaxID=2663857 RepID=A0A6I3JEC2_9ACTN|nr:branched-chain amino acid ABC transporter permease [Nocardioides marmotae]MCR6032821.1 branched-chain amino acid ABC transporter permease [Gordonia jinghuaiqii]MTB96471.1 branched-chain amino acid ABC transporter permease [Nocardioides marmotae]QKE02005.1 branched-chain amino acid ABC transporter permease [Nocardioides marmotae]
MDWLNAVVQGVLLGGQYALIACGLSLVFGVMRIVNLAHGALAVAAAYLTLLVVEQTPLPLPVALVVAVLVFAVVGYLLQRVLLNRSLGQGELAPLLVTFGVSVVLVNLLQELATANSRSISIGSLGTSSVKLADGLSLGVFSLLTFAIAVAVIGAIQLFLARTATGRAMRATSDDPGAARLMGIDDRHVYGLATAIAVGSVAIAGAFLGMSTQFTPGYGDLVLIFAFEAVIIGGLGSLWGTFLGGLVLGVAQTVGAQVDPAYGVLVGHLVFLAVLAFRPSGLMPRMVTA